MTGQGRRSAMKMKVVLVLCIVVLIQTEVAHAAVYNVGGSGGWTFNTVDWPKGKRFRAGDILAFNYPSGAHNVVAVNKDGYNECNTPRGAKVYNKGGDKVKLAKGQNYFICNFPGHLFKYPKGVHNVVIVNKANYDNCNASGKTFNSGNNSVTLGKGTNYFICGIPGHCSGGLKMAVTAN